MHDMMPQDNMNPTQDGGHDREGAMAKADLFKLANYSLKLFKQIQDDDQLEAWVQAKITKAADYIASVYHYLEYEMKFSQYGEKLSDAEMYSEDEKQAIKNKLMEAKEKIKELKKAQADKVKESEDRPAAKKKETTWTDKSGKKHPATQVQGSKSVAADKEANKERKKLDKELDESEDRPDSKKKETTWTDKSGKKHPATRVQGSKSVAADKEANKERKKLDKELDEGAKPDFLDVDKDKNEKESFKKAVADKKKKKVKENLKVVPNPSGAKNSEEAKKLGAMMPAKPGEKDPISQEGMGDGNLANNAKPYDKVTRGDVIAGRLGKDEKGGKAKKVKEGSIQGGVWTSAPPKKGEKDVPVPQNPDGGSAPAPKKPAAKPVKKAEADSTTAVAESVLAESAEVLRIKELTQRLLG